MKRPNALSRLSVALLAAILFLPAIPLRADSDILTLETAVRLALERNERSQSSEARLSAAAARLVKARAYFWPSISASGTYTRRPFEVTRTVGDQKIAVQNYNALSGNAQFNFILFDSHSIPTVNQARFEKRSQVYSTAEDKRQLAFDVSDAFLLTLGTSQVLEAARHRYDYARQALQAARARFAAGLVSSNDVTRAELEFASAEMGITQMQGQFETTVLQLAHLLDEPLEAGAKLEVPDFLILAAEGELSPAEKLVVEAQARRPDLNALRWDAKAQRALLLEPILKWLPSLNLNAQYRYTNEAGLTGRNFNWNAGLTMSWSLFDGFVRNADYSERKALALQADLGVRSSLRGIDLEVRDALVSLESQRASLKQAQVAFDVARKNAQEVAELYRQGISSVLQVADANVQLFEAEVDLVRQRYSLGTAYLSLEAALGLDPFGKEPKI